MTLNEWGGMRLMSEEEPEPGEVGFTSVVSMSVQPSPLKPQWPGSCGRCWEREEGRLGSVRFEIFHESLDHGEKVTFCK